jgi:hypothetical protein
VTSCGDEHDESCGPARLLDVESGVYVAEGAAPVQPPGPAKITVDRDNGVVRFEYEVGGRHIEEIWEIEAVGER